MRECLCEIRERSACRFFNTHTYKHAHIHAYTHIFTHTFTSPQLLGLVPFYYDYDGVTVLPHSIQRPHKYMYNLISFDQALMSTQYIHDYWHTPGMDVIR
jgi:hypothetical protein